MKYIVATPVADLRARPKQLSQDFSHDDDRLTQLLFNDSVELIEQQGEWLYVAAACQPRFDSEQLWQPYRGWLHESEVRALSIQIAFTHVIANKRFNANGMHYSFATYIDSHNLPLQGARSLDAPFCPKTLIRDAALFINDPYLWGGTGSYQSKPTSSVDCSGLIYLLYRAQGKIIPRDAHDQYLFSTQLKLWEGGDQGLQIGDLLFFTKEQSCRVSHVMLYCGNGTLMEAPQTGQCVRTLSLASLGITKEGNHLMVQRNDKKNIVQAATLQGIANAI